MTDDTAILLLKDQIKLFENGKDRTVGEALAYIENYIEALNMAIEALNTRDSLEKKVEFLTQQIRLWQSTEQQESDCAENMNEQETLNDDLISRSALKMAIREATYDFTEIPIRADRVVALIDNSPSIFRKMEGDKE